MNERKNLVKIFFSLLDTKKKSAKDRSLSSARRARPAQKKNKEGFVLSSTSRHICESQIDYFDYCIIVIIAGTQKKRDTKNERERKENKKDKTGIRNTSRPTALAAPNTPRAPSPFDACCATTSSSPRTLYTSSSSLYFSLFFLLFVCFYLEFPIVYFFPGAL